MGRFKKDGQRPARRGLCLEALEPRLLLGGAETVPAADPALVGVISHATGASVWVYDASPAGDISVGDIKVEWGWRGESIWKITINTPPDAAGLGLLITGTLYADTVKDARPEGSAPVSFIAAEAYVRNINLNSSLAGYGLNGRTLGTHVFAPDIDGDGDAADTQAIVCDSYLATVSVKGGITGDIAVARWDAYGVSLKSLTVAPPRGASGPGAAFFDGDLRTAGRIAKVSVTGPFTGAMTVGADKKGLSAGTLSVTGDFQGTVETAGSIEKIALSGGAFSGTIVSGGNVNSMALKAAGMSAGARVGVDGALRKLTVGGSISGEEGDDGMVQVLARSLGTVSVTGGVSHARIMAGTRLGDDWAPGGSGADADVCLPGEISKLTIGGSVHDSLITAGVSTTAFGLDLQELRDNGRFFADAGISRLTIGGGLFSSALAGEPWGVGAWSVSRYSIAGMKVGHLLVFTVT